MKSGNSKACLNHPEREAAARCTSCLTFFCRECITEHLDVLLCAACIARQAETASPRVSGKWVGLLLSWLTGGLAFASLWLLFYILGRLLAAIPSATHVDLLK